MRVTLMERADPQWDVWHLVLKMKQCLGDFKKQKRFL